MILEKQKEANVMTEGDSQESIGMSLDLDSAQVLMQMLSKNLYSDAIGSTIRECASNALDSHRRAAVNEPIIVSLKLTAQYNWEFTVEDFGLGLDAEDVRNIISKYGKSTKRDSANELGMMGLGFKAPLAYCSSFYFVCRKNGMERKYMMYEGEDVNTIDMLYEAPTDQRNGVKIIVPVGRGDTYNFKVKIREQLAYFENVFFDCGDYINNDFQIVRHEHFQFSPLASDSYLHVCLDNVYYSLDFNKLGIDRIDFPVALRFGLTDGIFPTPNRESIRYTKEAKETIMNKIIAVADYFVDAYNEQVKETEDIKTVIDSFRSNHKNVRALKGSQTSHWDTSWAKKFATKKFRKPKLKGVEKLDLEFINDNKDYLLEEYALKFQKNGNRIQSMDTRYNRVSYFSLDKPHYLIEDKMTKYMKDWVRINCKQHSAMIVKKEKQFKLGTSKQVGNGNMALLRNLLKLDNHPRADWRQLITEFRTIVNMLTKDWQPLNMSMIPQDFIDERKKRATKSSLTTTNANGQSVKRKRLSGEVIGKQATHLERYMQDQNCKWVSTTYQMADAHKTPYVMIYGAQKDVKTMDKLYDVLKKQKAKLAVFSERELKALKTIDLHNWINVEEFMKGNHKIIKRVVTAHLIDKFIDEHDKAFHSGDVFKGVSVDFHNKMMALIKYRNDHHADNEKEFMDELSKWMEEQKLVDTTIYDVLVDMRALFAKLTFLDPLFNSIGYVGGRAAEIAPVIADLFKYYKHRVNLDKYITLNEQPAAEQETIEELLNN